MKKLLLFIAGLHFAFLLAAQTAADQVVIKVKEGSVTINNLEVTPGWSLAAIEGTLGKADKIRTGYNITHTYNNLGIVLFEPEVNKLPSGAISEIQYFLGQTDSNSVRPDGLFEGSIKVEKVTVSGGITYTALKTKLKNYTETESYIAHNHRLAYHGLYIYFQYDETETHILKISIGVDKQH